MRFLRNFLRNIIFLVKRKSGTGDLRAGVPIEIEGLGTTFSGKYDVDPKTHEIEEDNYETEFETKRSQDSD